MNRSGVEIAGIVNITADSFSDGGKYLAPDSAIAHARTLAEEGADIVDLGARSSHPDAAFVSGEEEIARLAPVVAALRSTDVRISVDSSQVETQRWCIDAGVDIINDVSGFGAPHFWSELADAETDLVLMHSICRSDRATRESTDPAAVVRGVYEFFTRRMAELIKAGVQESRIILDPGMGFFLGEGPEPSLAVLREIPRLKQDFGRPLMISVSRKSFLGAITGRAIADRASATLAAELFAWRQGADILRTHDVAALADGIAVTSRLG